MKNLYITSVVEFRLKDRVEDVLSRELYGLIRNEESRFGETVKIQNLENANAYLNHQMDRLRKYAKAGEFEKFDFLASKLLKNSRVFLVYALNHVFEKWDGMRTTKAIKLIDKVCKLTREESSRLNYNRVWIDKKPGDFGRPLGVPEAEDRIYGHMMTRIMEAYLCGTDQYTSNQHGGVPGRGVLTFITELAKKLKTAHRVFEFDIKGYFDHIKHESILEMFKSQVILKYLKGALTSSPNKYKLPPRNKDEALNKYNKIRGFSEGLAASQMVMMEEMQIHLEFYKNAIENVEKSVSLLSDEDKLVIREWYSTNNTFLEDHQIFTYDNLVEGYVDLLNLELENHLEMFAAERDKLEKEYRETYWAHHTADLYQHNLKTLALVYKTLMETREEIKAIREDIFPFNSLHLEDPSEDSRAEGRDSWKELNLKEQGVPQGSSFGPVVASVLLGKQFPENALLYMDDGLIFMNNQAEQLHDWFYEINTKIKGIGCELAPEKSRTLRTLDLMTQGLKIVGTRWTQTRTFFNYTVSSETRKGSKKKFFPEIKENYLQILADLYSKGLITPSKYKVVRWYLKGDQLMKVRESTLFSIAEKIGILGNILSNAFSPSVTLEEMREQIEYGIFKANLKIQSSEGSLGQRILAQGKTLLIESTEGKIYVKPTLFTRRAIANDILLRYLKDELPIKSLQVQGLRKPRLPPRRPL